MTKILFFVFIFPGSLVFAADIAPQTLKENMKDFIQASGPNRGVGQSSHEKAFEYLKLKFEAIAKRSEGKVYVHEFAPDVEFATKNYQNDFDTKVEGMLSPDSADYQKWKKFTSGAIDFVNKYKGTRGKNLILELPGKDSSSVTYFGAHYDTITHNHKTMQFTPEEKTAGADDNASGVIGLLAIAKYLASQKRPHTLRFVLFDYEEVFFLGSYALAQDLKNQKLPWAKTGERFRGLYVLEMIGWSTKKKNPTVKIYGREQNADDKTLGESVLEASKSKQFHLSAKYLANGFDRSDNWSFWQSGFPAVCVSQDWEGDFDEKNYHTTHDDVGNLNFNYLSAVIQALSQIKL